MDAQSAPVGLELPACARVLSPEYGRRRAYRAASVTRARGQGHRRCAVSPFAGSATARTRPARLFTARCARPSLAAGNRARHGQFDRRVARPRTGPHSVSRV